jgi:TctA family transporter
VSVSVSVSVLSGQRRAAHHHTHPHLTQKQHARCAAVCARATEVFGTLSFLYLVIFGLAIFCHPWPMVSPFLLTLYSGTFAAPTCEFQRYADAKDLDPTQPALIASSETALALQRSVQIMRFVLSDSRFGRFHQLAPGGVCECTWGSACAGCSPGLPCCRPRYG